MCVERLFVQVYFEGKTLQCLFDYKGERWDEESGGERAVTRVTGLNQPGNPRHELAINSRVLGGDCAQCHENPAGRGITGRRDILDRTLLNRTIL